MAPSGWRRETLPSERWRQLQHDEDATTLTLRRTPTARSGTILWELGQCDRRPKSVLLQSRPRPEVVERTQIPCFGCDAQRHGHRPVPSRQIAPSEG